jgi:cytoskeletal protein RodZ
MLPEDIDSLFRNQLDGHQSAPGDDLWARLQAQLPATPEAQATPAAPVADDQRLDELFRSRLSQHTSKPPRELWERLEDEHLRPRKRRAAAWWPLAVAASVVLFLLVGGGLLWPGLHQGSEGIAGVNQASSSATESTSAAAQVAASTATKTTTEAPAATDVAGIKKNVAVQATAADRLSSSAPEGYGAAPRRPAAHFGQPARAVSSTYATLAPGRARQSGPAADSRPGTPSHQPTTGVVPVANVTNQPVAAQLPPTPAPAEVEVIEVEVRRGGSPAPVATAPAPAPEVASAAASGPGIGGQLGGLFHHAKGAVRLAKSGLAVAQNIPDNLTVQAHMGHRTLSKTIEL